MKKLMKLGLLLLAISALTGCVEESINKVNEGKEVVEEGKTKVEYVAKAGTTVLSVSNALLELQGLYQNPVNYGSETWVNDFKENKSIIEDAHKDLNSIAVPNNMQTTHNEFLMMLESVMKVNDSVALTLEKKEQLSNTISTQLNDSIKPFEELQSTYQTFFNKE